MKNIYIVEQKIGKMKEPIQPINNAFFTDKNLCILYAKSLKSFHKEKVLYITEIKVVSKKNIETILRSRKKSVEPNPSESLKERGVKSTNSSTPRSFSKEVLKIGK